MARYRIVRRPSRLNPFCMVYDLQEHVLLHGGKLCLQAGLPLKRQKKQ